MQEAIKSHFSEGIVISGEHSAWRQIKENYERIRTSIEAGSDGNQKKQDDLG